MTSVRVEAKVELQPWLRAMNHLGKSQLPYATASTLSSLAIGAQKDVRRAMPGIFDLTSKKAQNSIRIQKAKKSDWPHPYSIVGSKAEFAALQETGGVKRPKGGRMLAIPTRLSKPKGRPVTKARRPRAVIEKGTARFTSDRKSIRRIYKRKPDPVLFFLRRQARVKPRFGFEQLVEDSVRRRAQPTFNRAMRHALAGRR
jgi:hypothetical protein